MNDNQNLVLVTGAGGFIGGSLVRELRAWGCKRIRAVDAKPMRAGLEWFFRVLSEPRRLGPRYLRDNPVFMLNILQQALGKEPPPL